MAESASGEMLGVEQMHDGLAGEYRRPKFINSGARRGMVTEYGEQFEVVVGGGMHDPMYGMLSPEFRNAVAHLRVHIDRARRQLDTTVNLLAQFAKLQARVEPLLADLVVEPAPVRAALPPIPPTRSTSPATTASYSRAEPGAVAPGQFAGTTTAVFPAHGTSAGAPVRDLGGHGHADGGPGTR